MSANFNLTEIYDSKKTPICFPKNNPKTIPKGTGFNNVAKVNPWSETPAFANAGVSLEGLTFASLLNPVPLGIVLGLFFGKQIGVFLLSYISVKLKLADMPTGSTWPAFYAVSILTGIGFTMSLFVGNLAFANNLEYMDGVKIGVLTGSLLSTLFGYFLLLFFSKKWLTKL